MTRRAHWIDNDFLKRKKFLKTEIKKKILKSIIQNSSVSKLYKTTAQLKLLNIKKQSYISKQKNKCVLSGRSRGVYAFCDLSRHQIKQLNNKGLIQSVGVKNW